MSYYLNNDFCCLNPALIRSIQKISKWCNKTKTNPRNPNYICNIHLHNTDYGGRKCV